MLKFLYSLQEIFSLHHNPIGYLITSFGMGGIQGYLICSNWAQLNVIIFVCVYRIFLLDYCAYGNVEGTPLALN